MRISAWFQTLRGKLIFTYAAVTVLALLALEVTALLGVFVIAREPNTNTLTYLSDVVSMLAPQARLYLQPNTRDLAGLRAWLQTTYDGGTASLPAQGLFDSPAAAIIKAEPMVVLAPDQTIVAAAPASARSAIGSKYRPPQTVPGAQEILDNAARLELLSGRISVARPEGGYWMAVPVQQAQGAGPLAAIIVLAVHAPPTALSRWLPVMAWVLPATGLILLLAVAPFAALFGWIMSRGLTRRIAALRLAADAWSEGQFSVAPQDEAKDEISALGERLRRMAERLRTLMYIQQQLALAEERNRLARELHDTVKQASFATLMQVRAAKNLLEREPETARAHLNQAEALIKTSQQDLGMVISELRPAALEGRRLADALRDYVAVWSQQTRLPVDLQVQDQAHPPDEAEQALYRVAQEALANVTRHSQASAVTVRLALEQGRVTLRVADNGLGFDLASAKGGFGLQSMRDRMAAIQGNLLIQALPEGGTAVIASVDARDNARKD